MDIRKFWNEAVSYEEYIKEANERIENPRNKQDIDHKFYYELGFQRMNRMTEKYVPNNEHLLILRKKNFNGKILIISEPWCGDASQSIPVIVKFFSQNEVKITYLNQESSLIENYLTEGNKSIPIVIFLDEDFNEIAHWGPRPKYGKELLEKYKTNPDIYPKETFYNDLQVYYAKNKGYDTIEEILELI